MFNDTDDVLEMLVCVLLRMRMFGQMRKKRDEVNGQGDGYWCANVLNFGHF
ncbi:hypothetical protein JD969_09810 [Planctomycetota bacterium]|nr:hypothetical protein JD969_09810 [Planctomycetota bacterium]